MLPLFRKKFPSSKSITIQWFCSLSFFFRLCEKLCQVEKYVSIKLVNLLVFIKKIVVYNINKLILSLLTYPKWLKLGKRPNLKKKIGDKSRVNFAKRWWKNSHTNWVARFAFCNIFCFVLCPSCRFLSLYIFLLLWEGILMTTTYYFV